MTRLTNRQMLEDMSQVPMRIQMTLFNYLVAEVVVPYHMMDKTWAAYSVRKYKLGKPQGGACMQRADLPRMYDVPVGHFIPERKR